MHASFNALLAYQEADLLHVALKAELAHAPADIEVCQKAMAAAKTAELAARKQVQSMEVQRKALDTDLKATESQLVTFKAQQLSVKKAEAYEALSQEIAAAETRIQELEEAELTLLLEIDEAQEALKHKMATLEAQHDEAEARMQRLQKSAQALQGKVAEAEARVNACAQSVTEPYLRAYQRVRQRSLRPPWVVPVEDRKCMGCHLKLAGEVEAALQNAGAGSAIVTCESCGRILFDKNG